MDILNELFFIIANFDRITINTNSVQSIHQSFQDVYKRTLEEPLNPDQIDFLKTALNCQTDSEAKHTLALYRVFYERQEIVWRVTRSLDGVNTHFKNDGKRGMSIQTFPEFLELVNDPMLQYTQATSKEASEGQVDTEELSKILVKMFENMDKEREISFKIDNQKPLSTEEKVRVSQLTQRKRELGYDPSRKKLLGFNINLSLAPLTLPTKEMSLSDVLFPHRKAFKQLVADVKGSSVKISDEITTDNVRQYTDLILGKGLPYMTKLGLLSSIITATGVDESDPIVSQVAEFIKQNPVIDLSSASELSKQLQGLISRGLEEREPEPAKFYLTQAESIALKGLSPDLFRKVLSEERNYDALTISDHGIESDDLFKDFLQVDRQLIENGKVFFKEGKLQSWDTVALKFQPMSTSGYSFKLYTDEAGLVITTDKQMHCFNHLGGKRDNNGFVAFHSMISAGRPVMFAGSIIVDDGKILEVSDMSGHYQPTISSFEPLAVYFANQNILTADINVGGYGTKLVRLFETEGNLGVVSLKSLLASSALTETGRQCIKQLILDSIKSKEAELANELKVLVAYNGDHIRSQHIVTLINGYFKNQRIFSENLGREFPSFQQELGLEVPAKPKKEPQNQAFDLLRIFGKMTDSGADKKTLGKIEENLADLKAKKVLTPNGLTHAINAYKEVNEGLKERIDDIAERLGIQRQSEGGLPVAAAAIKAKGEEGPQKPPRKNKPPLKPSRKRRPGVILNEDPLNTRTFDV